MKKEFDNIQLIDRIENWKKIPDNNDNSVLLIICYLPDS